MLSWYESHGCLPPCHINTWSRTLLTPFISQDPALLFPGLGCCLVGMICSALGGAQRKSRITWGWLPSSPGDAASHQTSKSAKGLLFGVQQGTQVSCLALMDQFWPVFHWILWGPSLESIPKVETWLHAACNLSPLKFKVFKAPWICVPTSWSHVIMIDIKLNKWILQIRSYQFSRKPKAGVSVKASVHRGRRHHPPQPQPQPQPQELTPQCAEHPWNAKGNKTTLMWCRSKTYETSTAVEVILGCKTPQEYHDPDSKTSISACTKCKTQ